MVQEKRGLRGAWEALLLVVLIAALTLNVVYWGAKKDGYHIDEMFSYDQVCKTQYVRPENVPGYLNNWHDASFFEDFLVISDEEAFDLVGAWNTANINHAHPPLFFVVFELVTSLFFRNRFTKWSGLTTNLIFFVLHLVVFYLLARRIQKKRLLAFGTLLIYGISLGAVNTAIYIRMYMMLTFFSTLLFYLHSLLYEKLFDGNEKPGKCVPLFFGIALTLIGGALTQYYYLIFAFFSCLFFGLLLLIFGLRKYALQHAGFTCGSMLVYSAVCPSFVYDMLYSNRGTEALSNASNSEGLPNRFGKYLHIISAELFGSQAKKLVLFLLLLLMVFLLRRFWRSYALKCTRTGTGGCRIKLSPRQTLDKDSSAEVKKEYTVSPESVLLLSVFFACVCTCFVVSAVAPYQTDRYVMNLFPCLILTVCSALYGLALKAWRPKRMCTVVVCALLCMELLGYSLTGAEYLYPGYDKQLQLIEGYGKIPVVFVTGPEKVWAVSIAIPCLAKTGSVLPIKTSDMQALSDAFDDADGAVFLLFVGLGASLEEIQTVIPNIEAELLLRTSGMSADVYYVRCQSDTNGPE